MDVILAAERSFRTSIAGDFKFQRRQSLLPLRFCPPYFLDARWADLGPIVIELNDFDGIFVIRRLGSTQDGTCKSCRRSDFHEIGAKLTAVHRHAPSVLNPQPNVNANACTPGSRNSISNV